jgi:hypothetical protein
LPAASEYEYVPAGSSNVNNDEDVEKCWPFVRFMYHIVPDGRPDSGTLTINDCVVNVMETVRDEPLMVTVPASGEET